MERLAGYFILSWGWKRRLLALLAGALSALAMPPFDLFPVLFVTFPVFVWLLDATAADPSPTLIGRIAKWFATGWWFGFGYFLAGMWWIGAALLVEADRFAIFLPLAVLGLPAALALFWGLGALLAGALWREGWRRVLALAFGLGVAEYLRGTILTGFPWNSIGYASMTMPLTMQKAAVLGLYGATALSVAVFAAPAILAPRIPQNRLGAMAAILLLVVADVAFGAWRLARFPTHMVAGVSLRLVQPAIEQGEKWSPGAQDRSFRQLLDLSTRATSPDKPGLSGTTVLIWPETAFPFVLTERPDALSALGAMIPPGTVLVAGAVRVEPPAPGRKRELAFNSVYVIDDGGAIAAAADKRHLVPFGEYLPFRELAERLGLEQVVSTPGGFEAGTGPVLLDAGAAGSFLPLICYEAIFPREAFAGAPRPDFVVNLTNDAWFGMTPGPYQHWRQAVVRGVEEGLPMVRAANDGISSVSDPLGRVVEKAALGVRGVIDSELPAAVPATIFSRLGELPFLAILAVFFAISVWPGKRRRSMSALTHL